MPSRNSLPPHIRALLNPSAYPFSVSKIELIQTHISYVLMAGEQVFKLKKALDMGFADFRSLAQRKHDCEEEVRLNQRGCPNTYLGVVPVTRRGAAYELGGAGEAVDYAVHMRRLPEDRMLHKLLERDEVDLDMIGRLAARLADLHRTADRGARVSEIGGFANLTANWHETMESLQPYVGRTVSEPQLRRLKAYGSRMLAGEESLLAQRAADGWVRECHGDLRSDSVCFDDAVPGGICFYDCIEFNERFRYSDTGLDVAFLAMDLDFRGRPDLSDLLVGLYAAAMGDRDLPLLLGFFKCYRACVRGKVESFLLDQAEVSREQKTAARKRARAYFRLALSYLARPASTAMILFMGASGSGKSVFASSVAARLGCVLLSSDMLRGGGPAGAGAELLDEGRYAPRARAEVYQRLLALAEEYAKAGRGVVLDATFIRRDQRAPFLSLARRLRKRLLLVECQAPDEVVRRRQSQRAGQAWTTSEGSWEVYVQQKQDYEPPSDVESKDRILVQTERPLAEQIDAVLRVL